MKRRISFHAVFASLFIMFSSLGWGGDIGEMVEGWPGVKSQKADEQAQEILRARQEQWLNEITNWSGCSYASQISIKPPPKKVVLTFDDGPDAANHAYLLDVLKRHHIRATFFFVGKEAQAHPGLVADVVPAGHMVGSHSWDHANFHTLSVAKQAKEITDNEKLLKPYMNPLLFRYPYGNSSCETNRFLKARGYKFVGWHIDSCDWGFNKTGSVSSAVGRGCGVSARNMKNYVNHVVDTVRSYGGGIILMHEVQPNTVRKLEQILIALERDGFQFINLDAAEIQPDLW